MAGKGSLSKLRSTIQENGQMKTAMCVLHCWMLLFNHVCSYSMHVYFNLVVDRNIKEYLLSHLHFFSILWTKALSVTFYDTLKQFATSNCHFWSEGTQVWGMKLASKNQENKNNFHFTWKFTNCGALSSMGGLSKLVFHFSCLLKKHNLEEQQMLKIYFSASRAFGSNMKISLNYNWNSPAISSLTEMKRIDMTF